MKQCLAAHAGPKIRMLLTLAGVVFAWPASGVGHGTSSLAGGLFSLAFWRFLGTGLAGAGCLKKYVSIAPRLPLDMRAGLGTTGPLRLGGKPELAASPWSCAGAAQVASDRRARMLKVAMRCTLPRSNRCMPRCTWANNGFEYVAQFQSVVGGRAKAQDAQGARFKSKSQLLA